MVTNLDQAFMAARLPPAQILSRSIVRDSLDEHFKVVGEVIRMVALAAALLGAIVLCATSLLNVVERRREIGILSTIGAPPEQVMRLFFVEGASIVLAGGVFAVALSLVLTSIMLKAGERMLLHMTVPLQLSTLGLAQLGIGAVLVLLFLALAVRFALRDSVREALAYE